MKRTVCAEMWFCDDPACNCMNAVIVEKSDGRPTEHGWRAMEVLDSFDGWVPEDARLDDPDMSAEKMWAWLLSTIFNL